MTIYNLYDKQDLKTVSKIVQRALKGFNSEDVVQDVLLHLLSLKGQEITLKEVYRISNNTLERVKYQVKKDKCLVSLDATSAYDTPMIDQITYDDVEPTGKVRGSLIVKCLRCGKPVRRKISEMNRSKNTYCSNRCRATKPEMKEAA